MKLNLILPLVALSVLPASAVNIVFTSGIYQDSSGIAVPDGTLFALVADTNGDGKIGGANALSLASDTVANPISVLTSAQANATFSIGQSLTLGSLLGGDSVFWLGTFNGVANQSIQGMIDTVVNFNLTTSTSGKNYALYFFPGGTLNGSTGTIGSQVGAVSSLLVADAGNDAMTIPSSNSANVPQGAINTNLDPNGNVPVSALKAVNLVPEPSAALLGAVGALGLLRRRRN